MATNYTYTKKYIKYAYYKIPDIWIICHFEIIFYLELLRIHVLFSLLESILLYS